MTDFGKLLTDFLGDFLPQKRCLSPNTINSYVTTMKFFLRFCREKKFLQSTNLRLVLITRNVIIDFLKWLEVEKGDSPRTVNHRLSVIKSFFNYVQYEQPAFLMECQRIKNIPFKKYERKQISFMTEEQTQHLLSAPTKADRYWQRDMTMLNLLYDSGIRVQELANLQVRDIHIGIDSYIKVLGKGQKNRTIPLDLPMGKLLNEYCKYMKFDFIQMSSAPLFQNKQGNKLSRAGIALILKKYILRLKADGVNMPEHVSPHVLRHTKASHLRQNGVPLLCIKELLGHENITTTEVYATDTPEHLAECIRAGNRGIEIPQMKDEVISDRLLVWLESFKC